MHCAGGLFPAPLPQDSEGIEKVEELFHFLGSLLAKSIQDGRLVDLPFSTAFLKLLCMRGFDDAYTDPSSLVSSFSEESRVQFDVAASNPNTSSPHSFSHQTSIRPSEGGSGSSASQTFSKAPTLPPPSATTHSLSNPSLPHSLHTQASSSSNQKLSPQLQLNIQGATYSSTTPSFSPPDDDLTPTEAGVNNFLYNHSQPPANPWFYGLLGLEDLRLIHPHRHSSSSYSTLGIFSVSVAFYGFSKINNIFFLFSFFLKFNFFKKIFYNVSRVILQLPIGSFLFNL